MGRNGSSGGGWCCCCSRRCWLLGEFPPCGVLAADGPLDLDAYGVAMCSLLARLGGRGNRRPGTALISGEAETGAACEGGRGECACACRYSRDDEDEEAEEEAPASARSRSGTDSPRLRRGSRSLYMAAAECGCCGMFGAG